jgi:nucleoside-diphosphate-sugar epimerase
MERVNQLIVGAGYVGQRLARCLQAAGGRVHGVVGSVASAEALRAHGILATAWNLDDVDRADAPPTPEILTYLVAPPVQGTNDPRLSHCLQVVQPTQRLVYLSTTAVYGDVGGAVVDEETPPAPSSGRGVRRLAAENAARAFAESRGIDWVILRVPGIYGPDRLPLERLARGEPVLAPADAGMTNRIHVDDLVTALQLVAKHPRAAGRIYNVSDGAPCSTSEHFQRVAQLAGLPPPPVVTRAEAEGRISPAFLAYLDESRRLDSSRIRAELGFAPRYADPAEGIRASLPDQTGRA